ncbi:MAG: hypothetical protein PHU85_16335 [Phycisphaerae bacterium]|nr:hypothetical protein [Phycisphaerae bacterium]
MRTTILALVLAAVAAAPALAGGPDALKPAAATDNVMLDTQGFWRVRTVWETQELVLPNGEIKHVRIDGPSAFFQKNPAVLEAPESAYKVVEVPTVRLPADTPADWMKPEFDDGSWVRLRGPFLSNSIDENWKTILVRGEFEVIDQGQAGELFLSLAFRGGAVVYLNGMELTRVSMPKGEVTPHTPAEPYGLDSFITKDGFVMFRNDKSPENKAGMDARIRSLNSFRIPRDKMKKGVNVLAVSIHRAPTAAQYYMRHCKGTWALHDDCRWACIGLAGIRLLPSRAPPSARTSRWSKGGASRAGTRA